MFTVCCVVSVKPEGGWPLEEVCFIRCVYLQPVTLQALLTPDLTHTVWAALLCCLHTRHYKAAPGPPPPSLGDTHNSVQTSHLGKLKRQRSGSSDSVLTGGKVRRMDNATPATRSKEHLSAQAANNDGAAVRKYWCGGEKSGGVREEDDVVETMTVVLASCPVPVFTRLLQQVLSLQVGALSLVLSLVTQLVPFSLFLCVCCAISFSLSSGSRQSFLLAGWSCSLQSVKC